MIGVTDLAATIEGCIVFGVIVLGFTDLGFTVMVLVVLSFSMSWGSLF